MLCVAKSKKAQAAVELAIVASIIILAFSSLISFTARINQTQQHMQDVFRKQLIAAYGAGAAHNISQNMYYRAPNIIDPYTPGDLQYIPGSSGKVMWNSHGGGTDAEVSWSDNKEVSDIEYTKTFKRTETPGSYPVTHRTGVAYSGVLKKVVPVSGP